MSVSELIKSLPALKKKAEEHDEVTILTLELANKILELAERNHQLLQYIIKVLAAQKRLEKNHVQNNA